MKEVILIIGAIIGGLFLLLAPLIWLANSWDASRCADTAAVMGVPHSYSINTGCMVKPEGKPWVPLKSYRVY
jgi:hypothetical protein